MTFGEQNTEEEAFQLLDYAFEQGVNFIDTAGACPARAAEREREETAGAAPPTHKLNIADPE